MDFIFNEIINDLIQFDFFSGYKFRKRDSSFFFKTKGGKQIIELDHWTDAAKSSLVIYPIYGVRFDILSKWFEKFSVKKYKIKETEQVSLFLEICYLCKINFISV